MLPDELAALREALPGARERLAALESALQRATRGDRPHGRSAGVE